MVIMDSPARVIVQNKDMSESSNVEDSDPEASGDKPVGSDSDGDVEEGVGNEGWADSIAKILKTNKPKSKKTLVLSRAKKLCDVKPKAVGFEVQSQDGRVNEETAVPETLQEQTKSNEPPRKKRRELPNLRVKPNVLEKDRERTLGKIATKGVVQLFNVVRGQQKDIAVKLKEAGPLEAKQDKVLKNIDKRAFLDVLMGERSVDESRSNINVVEKNKPTWSVLREDFMMGAKLKDWDKNMEEQETEDERNIELE